MDSNTLYEYTDSYIAFLDIIGFKNLVAKNSCRQIVRLFQNIKNPISKMYLGTSVEIDVSEVKIKVMSDSICFHIATNKNYALLSIVAVCQAFQSELLDLDPPVILRGALIRGLLYQDGDITFGPGLTDAYLLEENKAKYPRIIIQQNILDSLIDLIGDGINCSDRNFIEVLYSMIYRDSFEKQELSCIDYMESYEGRDTHGTKTKELYDYVCSQIERLSDNKRDKWLYVKGQILRFRNFN